MPADKISLAAAKQDKLFYVVATAVVYRRSDGRCLILKRSEREVAHPGKWSVCGGKLEWSDLSLEHPDRVNGEVLDYLHTIDQLIAREVKEESGVDIKPELKYLYNMAYIRPDGVPTATVKFAAEYDQGEVVIEADAFTDHAWVNAAEVDNYDCLLGIPEEVKMTVELMKR